MYAIKWLPKDQDVVIDHTTRYDDPSVALGVAQNLLQLQPKTIWIENDEGALYMDDAAIRAIRI